MEQNQKIQGNLFDVLSVPTPEFDELTIGEFQTELFSLNDPNKKNEKNEKIEEFISKFPLFPNVSVPVKIEKPSYQSKLERILLKTKKNSHKDEYNFASLFQFKHNYMEILASYIPWFQIFSNVQVPEEFSKKPKGPVIASDWNSNLFLYAAALKDHCIYFFDMATQNWTIQVLRHEFHKEISCIKWRPKSESVLAVACKHGICVWDISKRIGGVIGQEQRGVCIYLRVSGFEPISHIEWSPDGNTIAAASIEDHRLLIWSLDESKAQWSYKFISKFNGGISRLGFSPNGKYLATFNITNSFRVWNTKDWSSEKWYNLNNSTSNFSWSADSKVLLFSEIDDDKIHIIKVQSEYSFKGNYSASIDLREYKNNNQKLCGKIKEFSLDPKGERLVVSFDNTDYIALMRCHFEDVNQSKMPVLPVGFIKGPISDSEEKQSPSELKFFSGFQKGSLMSCVFDSGKISFYPFYYE